MTRVRLVPCHVCLLAGSSFIYQQSFALSHRGRRVGFCVTLVSLSLTQSLLITSLNLIDFHIVTLIIRKLQAGNNPGIGCFRISQIQRVFSEVCAELLLVSVYGSRTAHARARGGARVLSEKEPHSCDAEEKDSDGTEAPKKSIFSLLTWAPYLSTRKAGAS